MGEAIAEDGNEPDTETVTEPEEPENPGDSDTTEGEESGAEEVPAVDGEDNSDDQTSEETPDAEENPAEEAGDLVISEDDTLEGEGTEINEGETATLAKPVITAKNGDQVLEDGVLLINDASSSVVFTLEKAEGVTEDVEFYYTTDGTAPVGGSATTENGGKYTGGVQMDPPTSENPIEQETTCVFKAVAYVPAKDGAEAQTSEAAEFTFKYTATTVELNVDTNEKDTYTKHNMFTVTLDAKGQPTVGSWDKKTLANAEDVIKVPMNASVDVTIEPAEGYKLEKAFWGESSEEQKPNEEGKIVFTGKTASVNTGIMVYAAQPEAEASELTSLTVYENKNLLNGQKGIYNVDLWKAYVIKGQDQNGTAYDLSKTEVAVTVDGKAADKAASSSELGYGGDNLKYIVTSEGIELPVGKAAAGKPIVVTVKEDTKELKATLKASSAVTEVTLKDTKMGGKVEQAPGTVRSYPLTIKDAKSTDKIDVKISDFKVDGAAPEGIDANQYFKAYVEGGNLMVVTNAFPAENAPKTGITATLTFENGSAEKAGVTGLVTGSNTVELTVKAEGTAKYAEKLTLKKVNTTVYTGQTTTVATVDFGKDTYNRGADVEIYDVPAGFSIIVDEEEVSPDARGVVMLREAGDTTPLDDSLKVTVKVKQGVAIGKQTIKARTTYQNDEGVVQAVGSIPVTVVRGIESIEATSIPQIYKVNNDANGRGAKPATAKIAVAYNTKGSYADAKAAAPKTKKVDYEIGRLDEGRNFVKDSKVLGGYVTVKNGTVTIAKEYVAKSGDKAESFAVKVTANDYQDNDVFDVVEFKVTSEAQTLGSIVFVEKGTLKPHERAPKKDKDPVSVDQLAQMQVIVVEDGAKLGESGAYDSDDVVGRRLYTLTPNKGNVVVNPNGTFTVNKLANNVTVTATPNDGGKKPAVKSVKFNVVSNQETDAAFDKIRVRYEVDYDGTWGLFDAQTTTKELDKPTGTVIHLSVVDGTKEAKALSEYGSIFDYKLAVKGAKTVKKSADNLELDIVMTAATATVTLSGAKGTTPKLYTIKNPNFDADKKKLTPKVSLQKGLKLYVGVKNQKLTFTMNTAVEDARFVAVSGQNTEEDTVKLLGMLSKDRVTLNPAVKEFSFTCNGEMPTFKKGASIAFTFLDRDGKVITQTTNALTIKTTALKKSYKLNPKYTLSEVDAVSVPLTGKASAVEKVEFTKLYNANIKGGVNFFKDGFELDAERGRIALKKDSTGKAAVVRDWVDDKGKSKPEHKNDWIGFVGYTVTYEDGEEVEFVSKIQVALAKTGAASKKYAASAVNVLNIQGDKPVSGVSYVTASKLPVGVKTAYADTTDFEVAKTEGNAVTLSVKPIADKASGKYTGDFYFIPEDSLYDVPVGSDGSINSEEIKKKGVKLKLTVNMKAVNSKNKIKVTTKSVSFLDKEPVKLALDKKFGEYYYAEVPYTVAVDAKIDDAKISPESLTATKDKVEFAALVNKDAPYLKVRKVTNKNAFGIYIDAKQFQKLADSDKNWSGNVFSKIKVTVPYEAEGTTADTFNLSVTMPNPWQTPTKDDWTTAERLLNKALGLIRNTITKEDVAGIKDVVYDATYRTLVITADDPEQEIETAVSDEIKNKIADALLKDDELNGYVTKLEKIKVTVGDDKTQASTEIVKDDKNQNKKFILDLVDEYTEKLVEKLAEEGKEAVWGSLDNRELDLVITATPSEGEATTESCTVQFKVDEGDELDGAIKNAIRRLNDAAAIPGIETIEYDQSEKAITIKSNNSKQDVVASKNAGRDSTVQILYGEMGEYIASVSEMTYSYQKGSIVNSVTVKNDGRETTEEYISTLVDRQTDELVRTVGGGEAVTYGRLDGKVLSVSVKFKDTSTASYTIRFEIAR